MGQYEVIFFREHRDVLDEITYTQRHSVRKLAKTQVETKHYFFSEVRKELKRLL